ncbi:NAD(P)/FAD-dependent oxidoreductase [Roseospira visakhapatnamensis]|uniref:Sulfide:quinone oxidoreductase n=1 Tax=Roseospira visakhapatnamensis TaxID=390880 RepID=A0A7W6W8C2_9PROT|nr:FAD/NAD(P)-binding oxidoreductase [Roseospira visakhapatnamensis]MBB4264860.1 sulfide:quinone oxidoreductase [Roseospira visakhapatnamensis]
MDKDTTRAPMEAPADDDAALARRGLDRRTLLKLSAAGAALATGATAVVPSARAQNAVRTKARIVIAGAGAAGLSMASRLARRLEGATITLIDARRRHLYQPGFTLVAAGLKSQDYPISRTADYIASGVEWIEEGVAEFDPDANQVVTESGRAVPYDYLVVAAGIDLDYDSLDGMEVSRVGRDGLGSHYGGPEAAHATWESLSHFLATGGTGLFMRPATEMKCAGAPLKYTFLADDRLRDRGRREDSQIIYAAHSKSLFSVPIVAEKVRMLFEDRGFDTRYEHVMTGIDLGRKEATFATPDGPKQISYDFINVIPPMRAAAAVRDSALPWQEGPFAADGWVEADKHTLRHPRFPNVFAVGDVAGVPKGKTAASVKWQVPVAADHLVAQLDGKDSDAVYDGYTSCPLITQMGRAMLVEFDYRNNLTPSFPGVVAPLEELWISWVMKTIALKPTYIAMLRGEA